MRDVKCARRGKEGESSKRGKWSRRLGGDKFLSFVYCRGRFVGKLFKWPICLQVQYLHGCELTIVREGTRWLGVMLVVANYRESL